MDNHSKLLDAIWPPPIEPSGEDQRRTPRQPMAPQGELYGRLAYGGQSTGLVGCEILDLSETGVRIETYAQIDDLPEYLSLEFGGAYHRARRRWRRGREIGLEFMADDIQPLEDK